MGLSLKDIGGAVLGGAAGFATGGPLGAFAGAASGLMGGEAGAAEDAGQVQLQASREAIEEQRRAEEQLRADLAPYSGFGFGALGPLSTAIGITPQQTFAPGGGAAAPVSQLKPTAKPGLNYTVDGNQATLNGANLQGYAPGAQPQPQGAVTPEIQQILDDIASVTAARQELLDDDNFSENDQMVIARTQQIDALQSQLPEDYQSLDLTGGLPGTAPWRLTQQANLAEQNTDLNRILSGIDQQQAQGPQQPLNATPSAFNSRADTLLGTSETNPLLAQAIQMRQDGSQILQNPLLKQMQEDVTRRVMANQAARGKLGSGSTLTSLQNELIPQALAFREQEIAGLTGLGTTAEDLRQREIGNLFNAAGMGANAAARTGQAGMTAAGNIGSLQTYGGEAQALAGLGAAQSRQNQFGQFMGAMSNLNFGGLPGDAAGLVRPQGAYGGQQAGPFQPTGAF